MNSSNLSEATVIAFPQSISRNKKVRKTGRNNNKEGSVRNINGKVYVDFMYLDERVRESSGLDWNRENEKTVREQLDKIIVAIKSDTFRFAEVFPESKKRHYFQEKEKKLYREKETPEQVNCKDFFNSWYDLLRQTGRVTERTLCGYKSYINLYLVPYFKDATFSDLNAVELERFIGWAKEQRYRGKPIENKTVNKCLTVLKMVCKSASIEYGWKNEFDPFFGFKKLVERDCYEDILPFSIDEQQRLIEELPDHWKPFFRVAFSTGLRNGEQIAIKPGDIDWDNQILHIRRAITLDENGKRAMGETKNKYSRRSIKLIPVMLDALKAQKEIYDKYQGKYFFCSTTGAQIYNSNLRRRVWISALKRANLQFREMKQTRHTFATIALACGESPLWIANVMGHRNTEMIIKCYSKFIEKANGTNDGNVFNNILKGTSRSDKE